MVSFLAPCLCRSQKEEALNFRVAKGNEISQLEKVHLPAKSLSFFY